MGDGSETQGMAELHVLSDVDTGEVIAFAVTDKNTGDSPLMTFFASGSFRRFSTFSGNATICNTLLTN